MTIEVEDRLKIVIWVGLTWALIITHEIDILEVPTSLSKSI